jgi:elongator complex protein 3
VAGRPVGGPVPPPGGVPGRRTGPDGRILSHIDWYASLPEEERLRTGAIVHRKPTRTLSGVAVVAVMTAPAACPHGRCTYCPGGPAFDSPQSYTGEEPSALRGAQFGWDARRITEHRLAVLERTGHPTSKVEVIVMGGTFPARPKRYRDTVFRGIYEGLNGAPASSLSAAQAAQASAVHRLVGLTVETRPDQCDGPILSDLLDAGVTRVELGVECLTDAVLERSQRAHDSTAVAEASRAVRARGLKLAYHLMLGLPGMDPARDLADVTRVFDDPAYRPDMVKLYPTLVLPGTALFEEWRAGRYAPYSTEVAAELLADIKARLPPWVRVQRIQRDIPARLIAAGVRASNLRQLAQAALARRGGRCRCLRCREAGRRASPAVDSYALRRTRYEAAGGTEEFLAFEDAGTDAVAAFLRLRLPLAPRPGELDAPVIRELKVLGRELDIGHAPQGASTLQHRGFGRRLVAEAERTARSEGFERLYVMSAVGTRAYYRRLGFEAAGPHLAKRLFA